MHETSGLRRAFGLGYVFVVALVLYVSVSDAGSINLRQLAAMWLPLIGFGAAVFLRGKSKE